MSPWRERLQRFFRPPDEDRLPWRLFWTGFLVRVLYLTLAHSYRMRGGEDHFHFGWEMARVARALVTGYGYADAFAGHSGPTAWVPRSIPLIIAAVFKLFGVYTAASAWVLETINSAFSAAIAPVVYRIALRCFADVPAAQGVRRPDAASIRPDAASIARWSAWLWALYPAAMQYAVRWIWEMSLSALLFSSVLLLALRIRGVGSAGRSPRRITSDWALFGLLWGLIALSNSSLLTCLPACALWAAWDSLRARRALGLLAARLALAAAICLAVIAPWIVRNQRAFGAFVPLRSNFGAELYESAQPFNQGFPSMATLPMEEAAPQYQRYRSMGELAYTRAQGERAKELIRQHPGLFLAHAAERVYFFWISVPRQADRPGELAGEVVRRLDYAFLSFAGLFGLALALRRRVPGAWLFFWAFALTPLVYYFITVQARFRHPIEPLIAILGAYLFQSAERSRR